MNRANWNPYHLPDFEKPSLLQFVDYLECAE